MGISKRTPRQLKTVLDSKRQVVAQKKSGVQFAAEIMVKEVFQKDATGRDIVEYIGFVRDLTQQFILLQANTINEVVSQLATVPIVIMNPRGIVLDFNAAACREFGFAMEEVVGKNIKMLMPEEIAVHHDGYLQKYRATRKKTVVDSTRRITAKPEMVARSWQKFLARGGQTRHGRAVYWLCARRLARTDYPATQD